MEICEDSKIAVRKMHQNNRYPKVKNKKKVHGCVWSE